MNPSFVLWQDTHPNFDKEVWKYLGLEILGVEEFNWR